ncbi:MAG: hypothetical protein LBJ00_15870 [Planctomycetaceae bacterium]|nr:hypothetical protein [Planctomycetaceae bacterium]
MKRLFKCEVYCPTGYGIICFGQIVFFRNSSISIRLSCPRRFILCAEFLFLTKAVLGEYLVKFGLRLLRFSLVGGIVLNGKEVTLTRCLFGGSGVIFGAMLQLL